MLAGDAGQGSRNVIPQSPRRIKGFPGRREVNQSVARQHRLHCAAGVSEDVQWDYPERFVRNNTLTEVSEIHSRRTLLPVMPKKDYAWTMEHRPTWSRRM